MLAICAISDLSKLLGNQASLIVGRIGFITVDAFISLIFRFFVFAAQIYFSIFDASSYFETAFFFFFFLGISYIVGSRQIVLIYGFDFYLYPKDVLDIIDFFNVFLFVDD